MTIRTYPLCYDLFDFTLARDDGEQFNAHNTGLEIETQRPKNPTPTPISKYCVSSNNQANTPGTAGGPGGRDRTLAVESRKTSEKNFFS